MGIYSNQIESLDELEDGAKIVIPDDVTNGGRALILLAEHGLINLDSSSGEIPALKDVDNPRDAGLLPTEDFIVLEEVIEGEGQNP